MRVRGSVAVIGAAFFWVLGSLAPEPAHAGPASIKWQTLQPGVELARIELGTQVPIGDNRLIAVRIDPRRAQLKLALSSATRQKPQSAAKWCATQGFAVAINAGMFRDDGKTNVGHLVDGAHVNNPRWVGKYKSALALRPRATGKGGERGEPAERDELAEPLATMVDLDDPGAQESLTSYPTVVQNLRLIKGEKSVGKNVWTGKLRRWSEAAVAMDAQAHILFLFSRTPFSMAEFNRLVLALPLGVVRAMHVEGGPEASLSIHAGGIDEDYFGSYETGFVEHDGNDHAWELPNVIGVVKAK